MMEISSPYYNIFDPPVVDNSTDSYESTEYREKNVTVKDLVSYELNSSDLNTWLLPHQSYLHVKGKILKEDETVITANDIVTIENNGFNLFKNARYEIGGKEIESIQHVGVVTTILNLVEFSHDYSKTCASNMFWHVDTSEQADKDRFSYVGSEVSLDSNVKIKNFVKAIKANINFNEGFLERFKRTKESKQISLFLPLSRLFGFCKDINRVFRGVTHTIKLDKNDDDNIIHCVGNNKYKFELSYLSWWVPKVRPSLTMIASLEKKISEENKINLMWEGARVYRSAIRTDRYGDWTVRSIQHKPSHIYIVLQKDDKLKVQTKTSMIFDHMNLTNIYVRVNSTQYPATAFQTDFSELNHDCARVYQSLLEAGLKSQNVDSGCDVSYADFSRLYPIFHFNLNHQESHLYEKSGPAEISVNFELKETPTDSYYVYCIIVSEKSMEINFIGRKTQIIH